METHGGVFRQGKVLNELCSIHPKNPNQLFTNGIIFHRQVLERMLCKHI